MLDNRPAFLLGSGISIPACLPSVKALTDTILCGDTFLRDLSIRLDSYYQNAVGRPANYEDLFYVVSELRDELTGERNDPIVKKAMEILRSGSDFDEPQLTFSLNNISKVVVSSLRKQPARLDHLRPLKAAWQETPLETLDIFTVNHDLVLEQYFQAQNIPFVNGFDAEINNVRYWNPTLFLADVTGIRLLKLHGSIDWCRFRRVGSNSWYDDLIGLSLETNPLDPWGKPQSPADKRPLLLIGTFNKIPEYTRRIFLELYYRFSRLLNRNNILISCGYGFADKGINEQILEWVYGDRNRRIVLVEPKPDDLRQRTGLAVFNKWCDWVQAGTLTIIPKGIEEVSWDEIRKKMDETKP